MSEVDMRNITNQTSKAPSFSSLNRALAWVLRGFEAHGELISDNTTRDEPLAPIYEEMASEPELEKVMLSLTGSAGPSLCDPKDHPSLTWMDVLRERLTPQHFKRQDNGLYYCTCKDIRIQLTREEFKELMCGVSGRLLHPPDHPEAEREQRTQYALTECLLEPMQQAKKLLGVLTQCNNYLVHHNLLSARTISDDCEITSHRIIDSNISSCSQTQGEASAPKASYQTSHGDINAVKKELKHTLSQPELQQSSQIKRPPKKIQKKRNQTVHGPSGAKRPRERPEQKQRGESEYREDYVNDAASRSSSPEERPKTTARQGPKKIAYNKEENDEGRAFVEDLLDNGASQSDVEREYNIRFGRFRSFRAIWAKYEIKDCYARAKENANSAPAKHRALDEGHVAKKEKPDQAPVE
ncbi:hypothetical protein N7541_007728 [Penicillium brevicompactum]|uniref:Uncharacterized protein n=1 Tax=Penicillium brevicompactum TaxID=5074 RepID=A0A9W9QXP5_PENBR|nr:hypothetical protein N7541_007728 [Penicillium brevicompactum]